MAQGEIDLGVLGGLGHQPWGAPGGSLVQYSSNDPLVCSSGSLGSLTIGQMTQRFPNAVPYFQDAGFSDTEIRNRTYPLMLITEAVLRDADGYSGGTGWQSRTNIRIPPGSWYFNSEIRMPQARIIGSGPQFYTGRGSGGTEMRIYPTNWKSVHGAQNNNIQILFAHWTYAGQQGLTPQPVSVSGGNEYMHYCTVEQCALHGNAVGASFWNPAQPTEIGFMMYNAGERTGLLNCHVWDMKGFGALVMGYTARPRVENCSMFYNQIAAVGQCTGTDSEVIYGDLSCDNNPYALFMFKAGSNVFNTGPFLPSPFSGMPGGVINMDRIKVEGFGCRSDGYAGMSGCAEGFHGKGGMWAHLTGRFKARIQGCTLNMHNAKLWAAVEVSDQDYLNAAFPGQGYAGGFQLDNSHVYIKNSHTGRAVRNWMADWRRQRVHPFTQWTADHDLSDFNWNNDFDGGAAWGERSSGKQIWTPTAASYIGTQPYINDAQVGLNWSGGTPTFNFHPVTGVNF